MNPKIKIENSTIGYSQKDLIDRLNSLSKIESSGLEERANSLGSRSIKNPLKLEVIDFLISLLDLTTLEGIDTKNKVHQIISKALFPDKGSDLKTHPAAVCLYNDRIGIASEILKEKYSSEKIHLAAVSTAFPSGRASLTVKLQDTEDALKSGADEIDMVIDRSKFLEGKYKEVLEEIETIRELTHSYHGRLKVILETGELGSNQNIKKASFLAMLARPDFIKTSTGKVGVNANPVTNLIMMRAVKEFYLSDRVQIGFKPAGGVKNTKDALKIYSLANEILGNLWLNPDFLRIGASTLLNDLLLQRHKIITGNYANPYEIGIE